MHADVALDTLNADLDAAGQHAHPCSIVTPAFCPALECMGRCSNYLQIHGGPRAHLFHDRGDGSAALAATGEWHDAEGAHVIAPPHDGHEGRLGACWPQRRYVRIRLLQTQLHVHGSTSPVPFCTLHQGNHSLRSLYR